RTDKSAIIRTLSELITMRIPEPATLEQTIEYADRVRKLSNNLRFINISVKKILTSLSLLVFASSKDYQATIDYLVLQKDLTQDIALETIISKVKRDQDLSKTTTGTETKALVVRKPGRGRARNNS